MITDDTTDTNIVKPKHAGGRPPFYNTPEEMQIEIDHYFEDADRRKAPYTVPGLSYWLGYATRMELSIIAREKPLFANTVSRARQRIEMQRMELMVSGLTSNTRGMQFDLVNNHGYSNESTIRLEGQVEIHEVEVRLEG